MCSQNLYHDLGQLGWSIVFEHDYIPELEMGYQVSLLVQSLVNQGVTLDEIEVYVLCNLMAEQAPAGSLEDEFHIKIVEEVHNRRFAAVPVQANQA